jgi:hypothetical protein
MPYISDLTPAQLRSSTKTQIITSIRDYLTAYFSKRQLIRFLLDRDRDNDTQVCTYYPDGQIKRTRDVERDIETAIKTGTRIIDWDYYANGAVQYITIITLDANDVETSRVRIRHNGNGVPVIEP